MNNDAFCYGSEDPQVCLNCKRSRCVLDSSQMYRQSVDPETKKVKTTGAEPSEFAEKLRKEMERTGMSANAVSKAALVSRKTVRNWIAGRTAPQPSKIKLLLEAMPNLVEVE